MLGLSLLPAIYLYSAPTDMRKNFDGLVGLVTAQLHKDPLRDGAFVFVNKRRDKMKILLWDRHGFWLLYKRLEAGCFQIPPNEPGEIPCGLPMSYPLAIGRKNYLFCGSHDAARRAGIIYSLVSMAKLHGIDPFVYIKDLLTRLPASTSKQIDQFLLPQWKPIE